MQAALQGDTIAKRKLERMAWWAKRKQEKIGKTESLSASRA